MIAASKSFTSYKMCDFRLLWPVFRTILLPTKNNQTNSRYIHGIFTYIDARIIKHKFKTLPTRLQILPIQTVWVTKSHNVRKQHTVIIIANDTTSKHNTFSFTSILAIQIIKRFIYSRQHILLRWIQANIRRYNQINTESLQNTILSHPFRQLSKHNIFHRTQLNII